jgi:hypothetical protein
VLIRDPKGHVAPHALRCPDREVPAVPISAWCVLRWHLDGTLHEARTHLGGAPQRQWSEQAITRTPPAGLGLFSLVPLVAHAWLQGERLPLRQAAWYPKTAPTFADTLAFVRQPLWLSVRASMSPETADTVKIPRVVFQHLTETLAFAT